MLIFLFYDFVKMPTYQAFQAADTKEADLRADKKQKSPASGSMVLNRSLKQT